LFIAKFSKSTGKRRESTDKVMNFINRSSPIYIAGFSEYFGSMLQGVGSSELEFRVDLSSVDLSTVDCGLSSSVPSAIPFTVSTNTLAPISSFYHVHQPAVSFSSIGNFPALKCHRCLFHVLALKVVTPGFFFSVYYRPVDRSGSPVLWLTNFHED
jgi:hypothetical protein